MQSTTIKKINLFNKSDESFKYTTFADGAWTVDQLGVSKAGLGGLIMDKSKEIRSLFWHPFKGVTQVMVELMVGIHVKNYHLKLFLRHMVIIIRKLNIKQELIHSNNI